MTIVGIDPGKDGALVTLLEDGSVRLDRMPVIVSGSRAFLDIPAVRGILSSTPIAGGCHVFIEKQQPLPKKMGGSNANFQRGYHLAVLETTCSALFIPYELVAPLRWQRLILADIVGDDTKARAILAADRLYPQLDLRCSPRARKPHQGFVDALLIMEYGRRWLGKTGVPPQ